MKNFNESGRSMVEMLGVLAIIGVLSVMGIAGYTTAMTKHKANTLFEETLKRAIAISGQLALGITSPTLDSFENTTEYGTFSSNIEQTEDKQQFKLSLSNVSKSVCEQLKSMLSLEEESFTFFSHENPNRKSTRDELIEQINKKEESALFYLDMQITQKKANNDMEGRSR